MNEYVAEYPRPPRIELISGSVAIYIQDEIIARDCEYIRVCETYHPPSIYIKPSAFTEGTLRQTDCSDITFQLALWQIWARVYVCIYTYNT